MERTQFDISDFLRVRLLEARSEFQEARDVCDRLIKVARDTSNSGDPALLDGVLEMRQAMRVGRQARLNYRRALKDFTDFVKREERTRCPEK
jgi:hypothetical protein